MSLRPVPGWQFVLADLSLILFLTTATALGQEQLIPGKGRDLVQQSAKPSGDPSLHWESGQAEPSSVYYAHIGAPSFDDWLTATMRDPREQLTLLGHYTLDTRAQVTAQMGAMAGEAEAHGFASRIVLQPGERSRIRASFAFDTAQPDEVARELQSVGAADP